MTKFKAEKREEERKAREAEQEELALSLGDTKERVKKYDRLKKKTRTKSIKDKKLRSFLEKTSDQSKHAALKAARLELLLQEEAGYLVAEGMEETRKFKQESIAAAVPIASSAHYFDLKLDTFGPYSFNYSRNGRSLLLGGQKGHLAHMDWKSKQLGCEFHVYQTVRDVHYLHNELMFAAAQKQYLYIYDTSGTELHCMKQYNRVNRLTFLPYHFLLVSADDYGNLHYLDVSTGQPVVTHRTHLGSLKTMAQNPRNAIIHLGHHNGTVTLWSPGVKNPLVKMLAHRGPVTGVAIDNNGWYMCTTGMEAVIKVWDVRTYKFLHSYPTRKPATAIDISQRGLLAVGKGKCVEIWQDALSTKQSIPYMSHLVSGDISDLQFCPFEDCLGIGHAKGFTSIIVPGAAEANFDALEVNPFENKRQRQEGEVKALLEKIPAELITLQVDQINRIAVGGAGEEEGKHPTSRASREKWKARGRSGVTKQVHKKQGEREQSKKALRKKQVQGVKVSEVEGITEEDTQREETAMTVDSILDRFR